MCIDLLYNLIGLVKYSERVDWNDETRSKNKLGEVKKKVTTGTETISTSEHQVNDRRECRYTTQNLDMAMTGDQNAPATDQPEQP